MLAAVPTCTRPLIGSEVSASRHPRVRSHATVHTAARLRLKPLAQSPALASTATTPALAAPAAATAPTTSTHAPARRLLRTARYYTRAPARRGHGRRKMATTRLATTPDDAFAALRRDVDTTLAYEASLRGRSEYAADARDATPAKRVNGDAKRGLDAALDAAAGARKRAREEAPPPTTCRTARSRSTRASPRRLRSRRTHHFCTTCRAWSTWSPWPRRCRCQARASRCRSTSSASPRGARAPSTRRGALPPCSSPTRIRAAVAGISHLRPTRGNRDERRHGSAAGHPARAASALGAGGGASAHPLLPGHQPGGRLVAARDAQLRRLRDGAQRPLPL